MSRCFPGKFWILLENINFRLFSLISLACSYVVEKCNFKILLNKTIKVSFSFGSWGGGENKIRKN